MKEKFAGCLLALCIFLTGCGVVSDSTSADEGPAESSAPPPDPPVTAVEEEGPFGQEAAINAYDQLMDHFGILLPHEEGFPNYPAEFGDAYYEDGYLWVCLTDDSSEVRQQYLDAVDLPQVLRFRKVAYGYNELYELQMAVAHTEGVDFVTIGTNVEENCVDVGVSDPSQAQAYLDLIAKALPPELADAFPEELPIVFSQKGPISTAS